MGRRGSGGRGGGGRWALVALLAVVVVVIGTLVADVVLRDLAEDRAAEEVSQVLGAPAEVDLGGTFAGLRLLTGRITEAHVTATDVPLEGAPVDADRIELFLTDVRIGLDDLTNGRDTLPEMGSGRFEARIDEAAVAGLVRAPRQLASVRLIEGGVAVRIAGFQLEADARAVDGDVVLAPRSSILELLSGEITLDLSDQPGMPYVEEVEVTEQAMVLRGRLEEFEAGRVEAGTGG